MARRYVPVAFEPVFLDDRLSAFEKTLFLYLSMRAGDRGIYFQSQENIAGNLNCSVKTVARAVKNLRSAGYLITKTRGRMHGAWLDYIITIPDTKTKMSENTPDTKTKMSERGRTKMSEHHIINQSHNGIKEYGSSKPGVFDDEQFNFNPDLNKNPNALNQLYTCIEQYNDRMGYYGDDRRYLTIQGMANFLEVLKTGRTKNGEPVKNHAALLKAWLNGSFAENRGSDGWVRDRIAEEREKLENGHGVPYTFCGERWTMIAPLRRID